MEWKTVKASKFPEQTIDGLFEWLVEGRDHCVFFLSQQTGNSLIAKSLSKDFPMTHADQIRAALAMALDRFEELAERPYKGEAALKVVVDPAFWASVHGAGETCHITVTTGVATSLSTFWLEAVQASDLLSGMGGRSADTLDPDWMVQISLAFLLHHEMEHYEMDHTKMGAGRGLVETSHPNARALLERVEASASLAGDHGFDAEDLSVIDRCLEMRADHDALSMILGAYGPDGWAEMRKRVACIFAVMILIDREDRKRGTISASHPRAATRIFQLLGHLAIMWSVPAQKLAWEAGRTEIDPVDLPSDAEITAYTETVVHPAFRDAARIATLAGADEIASELGDPTDFFADIERAHTKGADDPDGFITVGAKEWAELYPKNELAMKALGYRD